MYHYPFIFSVATALNSGCRHFKTISHYENGEDGQTHCKTKDLTSQFNGKIHTSI